MSLNKTNYLNILIIILQIILIKSSQPEEIQSEITTKINNYNAGSSSVKSEVSKAGGYTNTADVYGIQISYIESQAYTNSQNVKFPQVIISDNCKKKIKEDYKAEHIIVTKLFTTYDFPSTSNNYKAGITKITDVLYYKFYPLINDLIDTSKSIDISNFCSENDVLIYGPLYIDETLKKKFVAVAGQNPKSDVNNLRDYDIFDPDSKIYKDICYPITFSHASENVNSEDAFKNYDITLEQRKKYYFPGNLQLCPENCPYQGTDKDTVSTICKCKFEIRTISPHTTYINFASFKEEDFNDTKKDNYFSMETFKCIKLPFTKSGFKGNYGSIIMIALICITFLGYLILIISGKYHLLSVLELLYNSNIKSMNYIKNQNSGGTQIPFDARSNNYLMNSQRGITTNGLLMSNILSGNNFINGSNNIYNKPNPIRVGKKTNSKRDGVQIVNQNTLNKNKLQNDKKNLVKVDEVKENDFESERNSIAKDKTEINSANNKADLVDSKNNNNNDKNNNQKQEEKLNLNTKNEDKKEPKKEETNRSESEEEPEDEISHDDNKNNNNNDKKNEENNNNKSKENDNESKEDDEESDEEDEEENDSKANPPRKKHGTSRAGKNISNGNNENGNTNDTSKKKKKDKTPIEIALNVKDLRDMMLQNMPKETKKSNENGKTKTSQPPQNNFNPPKNNGFTFPPFMNPFSLMPPPNQNYNNYNNNEDAIRKEYENKARQRELEYQKERELAEMREKQRRREMEELYEKDLKRQRDLDYERERRQRDEQFNLLRNYGYNNNNYGNNNTGNNDRDRERDEILKKERERLNQQNEELQKMREKLEKEYNDKKYQDREKDIQLQKELSKVKDIQREKEIEFEKELLKQKELLKEQFEKEKKEIIEKKDKEIQILREEKDREIQRLKEDKDREMKYLKEDMDREKKTQEEKIKRKEKEFKKEKQKMKEMQKSTSNSFFMNGMNGNTTMQMQQQIMEMNNSFNKYEKIDTPQIVVPIDSIFTDQELNAMDFNNSCLYDKRTLCQTYFSFINRKHPLFFLFNYNSSSSSSISTFQINYKSVKFIIFCVELMIYMFFYATFFGSKSITYIWLGEFNFKKKCIFAIILSPFCMIAKSVIHHFIYDKMNVKIAEIKMRCYSNFIVGKKPEEIKVNEFKDFWESEEEQKNNVKEEEKEKKEEQADIQEIEDDNLPEEEKMRRKDKYEKRKLKSLINELIKLFKKKILISAIVMVFVLFIMWYYISAFCAVYKNSQLVFFANILISFGFSNLIPFVYCLIPTIFRQDGVKEQSRFAFFIAKIFQII